MVTLDTIGWLLIYVSVLWYLIVVVMVLPTAWANLNIVIKDGVPWYRRWYLKTTYSIREIRRWDLKGLCIQVVTVQGVLVFVTWLLIMVVVGVWEVYG